MLEQYPLGNTGMSVAKLSLGTVKLGRATGVKYPTPVKIPSDQEALTLLRSAKDLGINLIDTAPAYGDSEQRLGKLLKGERQDWLLCTKVGESYDGETSSYDFTPEATRTSVRRSLEYLGTDYLDIVLVHSDGSDLEIVQQYGTLAALHELKAEGLIRAVGISHKSAAGAGAALAAGVDVLMATLNPEYQDEAAIISEAGSLGVGVLVKKALSSGHGQISDLTWVAEQPGVSSIVIGTTNPEHLRSNAEAVS